MRLKILTCCIVLVLFGIPASACGDAASPRALVVYAGNGSSADTQIVVDKLGAMGWTRQQLKSGYGQVDHDKLSNYPDDSYAADLVWWSGHGWHDGYLPIYAWDAQDARYEFKIASDNWEDHVRFSKASGSAYSWWHHRPNGYEAYHDDPVNDKVPERVAWEVGTTFTDSTRTYTNSRWNHNIEWVIITACSQMNNYPKIVALADYNSGVPSYYSYDQPSAAYGWAKALLGTPNKAHSVWGYRWGGPADGPDVDVAEEFFLAANANNSVLWSWLTANESVAYYGWAGATHYGNTNERLWNEGWTGADDVGSSDVDYWYSAGSDNTQTYINMRGAKVGVPGVYCTGLGVQQQASLRVNGAARVLEVVGPIPGTSESAELIVTGDAKAGALDVLGSLGVPAPSDTSTGVASSRRGGKTAFVLDNGKASVFLREVSESSAGTMAPDAEASVRRLLSNATSSSPDLIPLDVRTINRQGMGDMGEEDPAPSGDSVWATIIGFEHRLANGTLVSANGAEGVTLIADSAGAVWLKYLYHPVRTSGVRLRPQLSAQMALRRIADDETANLPPSARVLRMQLVAMIPEGAKPGDRTRAMWRVDMEGGPYYVDAQAEPVAQ